MTMKYRFLTTSMGGIRKLTDFDKLESKINEQWTVKEVALLTTAMNSLSLIPDTPLKWEVVSAIGSLGNGRSLDPMFDIIRFLMCF